MVVPRDHADKFSQHFFKEHSKRLEQGEVYSTLEQQKRAQDAGIHIYVCKQEAGDIVILPSRGWFQVRLLYLLSIGSLNAWQNTVVRGDCIAASWPRYTISCIENALEHELPLQNRYDRHRFQYLVSHLLQHLHAGAYQDSKNVIPLFEGPKHQSGNSASPRSDRFGTAGVETF